ncbi:hypothetical protein EMIT0111MI5_40217 [Burkholderia sp. IT-111MI5]
MMQCTIGAHMHRAVQACPEETQPMH